MRYREADTQIGGRGKRMEGREKDKLKFKLAKRAFVYYSLTVRQVRQ